MIKGKLRLFIYLALILVVTIRVLVFYKNGGLENSVIEASGKYHNGEFHTIEGKITTYPEIKENNQVFFFEPTPVYPADESELIRVSTSRYEDLKYGEYINVSGKISRPRNFASDNDKEFDYINYLAKDGVFFEIKKAKIQKIESDSESGSLSGNLYGLKSWFTKNVKEILPEPHASLANGLVVGEKSSLGKDLLDDFRDAGLIHIIVLSGFNITIIGLMIRKMLLWLPRRWGIVFGGLALILFGITVGGGATVVRSCLMASVSLLAEAVYRPYSAWKGLMIAGLLMVFIKPSILMHDPSFQLSFLATTGLMTFSSPMEKRFTFIPEAFGMRGTVASTLSTQITVTPMLIHMMGSVSLIGTFVNIVVLPIIPFTMLVVGVAGLLGGISHLSDLAISFLAYLPLEYILTLVEWSAMLPFATIEI